MIRILLWWLSVGVTAAWAAPPLVGFGLNKPPYVFEQAQTGLEVEIISAAFKAAGIEIKMHFAPQSRLHAQLSAGQIDAIVTTLEQSGVSAYYSDSYLSYQNYAISLTSNKLDIRSQDDLSRYSVTAFQRASQILGDRFHAAILKSPGYTEQAQQRTRNLLLYLGRVDVVVGDKRIFNYFSRDIADQVDTSQAVTFHDIFPPTHYKVGFKNQALRDAFNRGLATIRQDGTYARIEKRYEEY
ncbi:polar amino acid transport system substrate-binding protein [Chitinivorax tropicus]|uniref:Polar amino acid transport system substrate-binding protein n=1 Tax=Chitinivorax tropicus TaxID=714531 RepID=A0A840MTW5_9PROT|nr:transporter substrate-binding domain-containing protein [Chitinivorax tropicus]MBB5019733.1 polar amino acid transport system substrate-binding protein [Chitinivorax tropicus]